MLHPFSLVRQGRFYTFLTSGLIHSDMGHLFFNMFSFYFFAPALEQLVGHWQFLVIYVVSLVLSNVSTVLKHRDDPDYFCLGASGAVTAVVFSFIIYEPRSEIIVFVIPMPALLYAGLFVAYSYYAARRSQSRINHAAHLWGAISGLALTLVLDPGAFTHFFQVLHIAR